MKFQTKSTKVKQYSSGMKRDTDENKPRFDLIPYEPLKRIADLYARGAVKYGDSNWKKANSQEEYDRLRASAARHFNKWLHHIDEGEDEFAGAVWNLIAYEWHTKHKTTK